MSSHCVSSPGLLEELDDELWGETERDGSNWVGVASTDDSELFSGVWSLNDKKKRDYDPHTVQYYNAHVCF